MSLKEKLSEDLKLSMKEKDTIKKNTVQSMRAAILQVEKDKLITLDEDGVIEVIAKELEKRQDVLPDYEKSGREDLIADLKKEIEIITGYLPSQLSHDELDEIVLKAIEETGASTMKDIEKAIQASDLGINPANDGRVIRLVFPPLNEERRLELTRQVAKLCENGKVAVRNIRRDALEKYKAMKKNSEITEDDLKKSEQDVQKLTDKYCKLADDAADKKSKELQEI